MLFSNNKVADYINNHYESSWKSLRPVPKVSIDFGNGTVVNRTLNGNIATFICTSDGTIIDVIAGMYQPEDFLQRLQLAEELVKKLPPAGPERIQYLTAFHDSEAARALSGIYSPGLKDDINENGPRYRQIHTRLAAEPLAKPDDITHWLYKQVLHADIDDPYLGLKPVLFATYPFKDEGSN